MHYVLTGTAPGPRGPCTQGWAPGTCVLRGSRVILTDGQVWAPLASGVLILDTQLGGCRALLFVLNKKCSRPSRTGIEVTGQYFCDHVKVFQGLTIWFSSWGFLAAGVRVCVCVCVFVSLCVCVCLCGV